MANAKSARRRCWRKWPSTVTANIPNLRPANRRQPHSPQSRHPHGTHALFAGGASANGNHKAIKAVITRAFFNGSDGPKPALADPAAEALTRLQARDDYIFCSRLGRADSIRRRSVAASRRSRCRRVATAAISCAPPRRREPRGAPCRRAVRTGLPGTLADHDHRALSRFRPDPGLSATADEEGFSDTRSLRTISIATSDLSSPTRTLCH
jgi:hypothetical protein